jgi:hypothetical protein
MYVFACGSYSLPLVDILAAVKHCIIGVVDIRLLLAK